MQPAQAADGSAARRGLLLVGHGTRDPAGVAALLNTAAELAAVCRPVPVEAGFLELARPTIEQAVERLVGRGARDVVAVPAILLAAAHIKRDIPAALRAAAGPHPGVTVRLARHLGCDERIVALARLRFYEALHRSAWPPGAAERETEVVLVGRGSRDREAVAELHRFARALEDALVAGPAGASSPVVKGMHVALLAMAEPKLDDMLAAVAEAAPARVVVQPHLLYAGELSARIVRRVASLRDLHPRTEWLAAEPLGPHSLLTAALAELAAAPGDMAGEAGGECGQCAGA